MSAIFLFCQQCLCTEKNAIIVLWLPNPENFLGDSFYWPLIGSCYMLVFATVREPLCVVFAQVLHVIDEVLVPLMSVSPENSIDNPDAATFLAQSESVQLGSHRVRWVQFLPLSYRNRLERKSKGLLNIDKINYYIILICRYFTRQQIICLSPEHFLHLNFPISFYPKRFVIFITQQWLLWF